MVHALQEVKRVLIPGGILIDLRPISGHSRIEVATGQGNCDVGPIEDLPEEFANDVAVANALAHASKAGWFTLEGSETFDFMFYWDSLHEMQAYIEEKWKGSSFIPKDVLARAWKIWSNSNAAKSMCARLKMHIARWRELPGH